MVTIEESVLEGGFGSAVWESLERGERAGERDGAHQGARLHRLELPSEFHEHGSRDRLLVRYGLTPEGIAAAVRTIVGKRPAARSLAAA